MARSLSLVAERHPLASPAAQRERLASLPIVRSFDDAAGTLRTGPVEVLQLNVGKVCNQTCAHCHVDAGPDRTEVMPDDVVEAALAVLARERIPVLDITGGAPELHPRFEHIVARARASGARVIDRCNLTVLTSPRSGHLPAFLADHDVEIVCSLPFWEGGRTDAQRGDGVFDKSIEALKLLNAQGYGVPGMGKELVVVSNPTGAFLPPPQRAFEADFRRALDKVGVQVSRVLVLANMPLGRYLEWLDRSGNTVRYLDKLVAGFNPTAAAGVMCRTTLSVAWDGSLYDCDFNQMLELPLIGTREAGIPATILDWAASPSGGEGLAGRPIATAAHCFGCTAGQGSSCGGALTQVEPS